MGAIAGSGDGRSGRWSVFHTRSRMLLWRSAVKIGKGIEWICTGSHPMFILALATAILLWLSLWTALLVLYSALLLLWLAAKAKTRVVIETLEDHTNSTDQFEESGDCAGAANRSDPHRLDASGMAGLLATQLTEMRNTYQLLQEPVGRPHPGTVDGAIQLEDIGDVLRSAFTTQSTLRIGPITLPIGGLVALLGRLMQAPHLRGAIYGDDTDLTLTASLRMHGHDYVWTVSRRVDEAETSTRARTQMVAELAYRVFTDLSLHAQAEWPATRYWLDALKERQACQRTPRDRRLHLETAETHLRNALAEDERFYLAAYNLGIVYRQLAEEDGKRGVPDEPYTRSALSVFDYAINRLDRERWEAYFGLAVAHWKLTPEQSVRDLERRCNRVVGLCDRALELPSGRAARAQIQDLKAMAQQKLGLGEAALSTRHSACGSILNELSLAELWRGPPADGQRTLRLHKQASQCLLNLAIAYHEVEPPSKAKPRWASNPVHRRDRQFKRIKALEKAAKHVEKAVKRVADARRDRRFNRIKAIEKGFLAVLSG